MTGSASHIGHDLRSLLFAPGSDEHVLHKALVSSADGVVADLEDSVAPAEKQNARAIIRRVFTESEKDAAWIVRINGFGSEWFDDDVAATSELPLDAIVLPKATPDGLHALGEEGPPVIALVETAQGLRLAYEIASHPRVAALALGALDLGLELRLESRSDGHELLWARSKAVVDSAAAGIRGPFDAVHPDVLDDDGLDAECRLIRSLGLRGKLCIHPRQVQVVNAVFAPDDAELDRSRRLVDAYEAAVASGRGVVALAGEMIDLPVVERARRALGQVKRRVPDGE